MINTLADEFKLSHQAYLNWKKYKGLLYNDECEVS